MIGKENSFYYAIISRNSVLIITVNGIYKPESKSVRNTFIPFVKLTLEMYD